MAKKAAAIALITILYFLLIQKAQSNILWCYDCDPSDGDSCKSPQQSGIKASVCEKADTQSAGLKRQLRKIEKDVIEPRAQNQTLTFECVSIHFISYENSADTGIYRGCYERTNEIASTCDLLTEEVNKGNLTFCRACSDNSCNLHEINTGSGSVAFVSNMFSIVVGFLCFLVLRFD